MLFPDNSQTVLDIRHIWRHKCPLPQYIRILFGNLNSRDQIGRGVSAPKKCSPVQIKHVCCKSHKGCKHKYRNIYLVFQTIHLQNSDCLVSGRNQSSSCCLSHSTISRRGSSIVLIFHRRFAFTLNVEIT